MQPGTIRNYLTLIKQLNEFALCNKPRDVFVVDNCHLIMAVCSNCLSLAARSDNNQSKPHKILEMNYSI